MQPLGYAGPHGPMREDEKINDGGRFMDSDKHFSPPIAGAAYPMKEFVMDYFAQGSGDNSMDERRTQLDDVRPGGQQQPNSNMNHRYNQISDYIAQPQSMQYQHFSSQNEDHSRYTELSSIRPESVTDGQHPMAQQQYSSHPQHAVRGHGGASSGQRHAQLPPSGPQAPYSNDYV